MFFGLLSPMFCLILPATPADVQLLKLSRAQRKNQHAEIELTCVQIARYETSCHLETLKLEHIVNFQVPQNHVLRVKFYFFMEDCQQTTTGSV